MLTRERRQDPARREESDAVKTSPTASRRARRDAGRVASYLLRSAGDQAVPETLKLGGDDSSRAHSEGLSQDFSLGPRGGEPLPGSVRRALVPYLGEVADRVRVHAPRGEDFVERDMKAAAVTVGTDVFLGRGAASRGHDDARTVRTLMHEAVHAFQQGGARGPAPTGLAPAGDAYEREAHDFASAMSWGHRSADYSRVAAAVGPGPQTSAPSAAAAAAPRLSLGRLAAQPVELTYDDGPDSAGNTRRTLDHLNKANARATFYLVGSRVKQGDNWRVVFDIAASGHWIGNHAFDWDDAGDEHIFLQGTKHERAAKILQTEFAIRDALIAGKADAQKNKKWDTIPQANRDYIDDVIARGTGRFRTPGFKSKWWREDERITLNALDSLNLILEAAGLRSLQITRVGKLNVEGADIDPADYAKGRTQAEVEKGVIDNLADDKSILLHSRIAASAEATPAIVAEINKRGYSYTGTVRGSASLVPGSGFGGLKAEASWLERFVQQVIPIRPAVTRNVTDPIDRTLTTQTGVAWAQHSGGKSYLVLIYIENSSLHPGQTKILFLTFIDADLKDAALARALPNQPRGIQTIPWAAILTIPSNPPASAASK